MMRVTLIGREGKREFKNESGVKAVMERECGKFRGCSLKLVHLDNMSFCEQVCILDYFSFFNVLIRRHC